MNKNLFIYRIKVLKIIALHTQSQETLHKVTDHGDMIDRVTGSILSVNFRVTDRIDPVTQLQSAVIDHITHWIGDFMQSFQHLLPYCRTHLNSTNVWIALIVVRVAC